jgi:hypothetical protein
MANECFPLYETGDISAITTAAVTGQRFVNISASFSSGPGLSTTSEGSNIKVAHATAAGIAFGVAAYDAASGAHVAVIGTPGRIVPVTAGGAITAGAQVEVGTTGKAVVLASGIAVGTAVSTTSADGDTVYVKLTK